MLFVGFFSFAICRFVVWLRFGKLINSWASYAHHPFSSNGQEVNEWFWASKEKEDGRGLPLPYVKEETVKVHLWVTLNTLTGWEAV